MAYVTKMKFETYKGNRLIVLDSEGKYPFSFGKKKAQLVVEHFAAIKAFAEESAATPAQQDDDAIPE
jgi:hypothetical protein